MTARIELTFWEVEFPLCWSLSARSCYRTSLTTCQRPRPRTTTRRRNIDGQQSHQGDNETYALGNASTGTSFDVVKNLLDLRSILLSPQRLASFDVQEAERIDRIEGFEELRLRECLFGVILNVVPTCGGK